MIVDATASRATIASSSRALGPAPNTSEAMPEAQIPLGPLGDADFAVEAQPLGPRPGVGHQQRAEDGDHAEDDGGVR